MSKEFDLEVDGHKLHARKETDGKILIDVPNAFLYRNSPSNGKMCERHEQIFYPNGRNPANLYTQCTPFKTTLNQPKPLNEEDIPILVQIRRRQQVSAPKAEEPKEITPLKGEDRGTFLTRCIESGETPERCRIIWTEAYPEEKGAARQAMVSFDKVEPGDGEPKLRSAEETLLVHNLKRRIEKNAR